MNQALNSVQQGGTAVVMGMHALKEEVPISAGALIAQNRAAVGLFCRFRRARWWICQSCWNCIAGADCLWTS